MADLVNFFIAGAQKGGTTALANLLGRHSWIQMSRVKEVHHVDSEKLDWAAPNCERPHAEFEWTGAPLLRREATPIYLYWPHAMARLKQYNPDAKLIILLRHPALRAHSHWRMEMLRGYDTLSFADAVSAAGSQRVQRSPNGVHRVFSNVERFLGAGPDISRKAGREYIVPVSSSHHGSLPASARTRLDQLYEADIRKCAELPPALACWFRQLRNLGGNAYLMFVPNCEKVHEK